MNQFITDATMLKSFFTKCLLIGVTLLLAGCVINPPYTFTPAEKTASLTLLNMSKATMCKDSEFYSIARPEGKTDAPIPTGERISLGTFMQYSGYNVTYTCYPFLSFIPKEGEKYILHNFVRNEKCYVELVREDNSTVTGVKYEQSLGPRNCFKKKND